MQVSKFRIALSHIFMYHPLESYSLVIMEKFKMKIILDESRKEAVLIKNDGTEISRYTYKKLINSDYTFEDFKKDNEEFNKTLALHEEFDNIRELSTSVSIHNW